MENSERGVWRLTPAGAAMSDSELSAVPRRVREMDRQRREAREAAEAGVRGAAGGGAFRQF